MCIAFFEWTEDRFVVCHNRDEYFSRPTVNTQWWPDDGVAKGGKGDDRFEILAPRDVVSGGTWFGFEKTTGRCAFLTNINDGGDDNTVYASSRGELVIRYLTSDPSLSALDYLRREFGRREGGSGGDDLSPRTVYAGFNLVVFSGRDLAYVSNRSQVQNHDDDNSSSNSDNKRGEKKIPRCECEEPIALEKGKPYGLSNSLLQEPMIKVTKGLQIFQQVVRQHRDATPTARNTNNDEAARNDRMLDELEELMRETRVFHDEHQDGLAPTALELSKADVRKHRSSIIRIPRDDHEYGTRTTIRFLLESSKREVPNDGDGRPPSRFLRWIEKNWNPNALEPEHCLDLGCSIPSHGS